MDIKAKVEELVNKAKNDKDFSKSFMKDPIKAVEEVVGVDLPDEQIKKLVEGVKGKIKLDDLAGKVGGLGGLTNMLKGDKKDEKKDKE